ncbi:MAG TPA: cytochrome P450, partial [Casimicrobiaceae bacterium]
GVRHNDIVSQLIDARDRQTAAPMPDRQLLDEIMTLIIAGHETTASSLNWFWYLLSQAPDVAARLHAEVDAGEADAPGYDALERLPFTRRAIDETLRLYPPGWLLTRRSIAEDTVGGMPMPPATDVLLSPYLVQRHPDHWPDPVRFDPDRFLPERTAGRNRFAYLPFGLGPRACIGEHLALVEMHTHVATLARRFALELVPGQIVEVEPQVNLRTRQPLRMIPRQRH